MNDGDGRIKYSNIAADEVQEKSKQLSIQNLDEQNAIIGHIIHTTTTRSEKEYEKDSFDVDINSSSEKIKKTTTDMAIKVPIW